MERQQLTLCRFNKSGTISLGHPLGKCRHVHSRQLLAHLAANGVGHHLLDRQTMPQTERVRLANGLPHGCIPTGRTLIGPEEHVTDGRQLVLTG